MHIELQACNVCVFVCVCVCVCARARAFVSTDFRGHSALAMAEEAARVWGEGLTESVRLLRRIEDYVRRFVMTSSCHRSTYIQVCTCFSFFLSRSPNTPTAFHGSAGGVRVRINSGCHCATPARAGGVGGGRSRDRPVAPRASTLFQL
jgi:hypothetical protein